MYQQIVCPRIKLRALCMQGLHTANRELKAGTWSQELTQRAWSLLGFQSADLADQADFANVLPAE